MQAITLRLTPEDDKTLALLAEAEGISKQEATVRAIREAAARLSLVVCSTGSAASILMPPDDPAHDLVIAATTGETSYGENAAQLSSWH